MICGDCLYYIGGVCTIYNANAKKNNDSKACLRYIDKTTLNAKVVVFVKHQLDFLAAMRIKNGNMY